MWTYDQSDGHLYDPSGEYVGRGYSGQKGAFRNNGDCESIAGKGPIPKGKWFIKLDGPHAGLAAPVFRLTPNGHDANGRTGFLIHGDSLNNNASKGCIILAKPLRLLLAERLNESAELNVIP